MITLCHSFRLIFQSQAGIEAERLRVNASVRSLQQQLEDCRDESGHWMEQFHATRDELRSAKQEWVPVGSRAHVADKVCSLSPARMCHFH